MDKLARDIFPPPLSVLTPQIILSHGIKRKRTANGKTGRQTLR